MPFPFNQSRVKTFSPGDTLSAATINAIQDGILLLGSTAALARPTHIDLASVQAIDAPASQPAWTLTNHLSDGAAIAPSAVNSIAQFQLPVAKGDVLRAVEVSTNLTLSTGLTATIRSRKTATGSSDPVTSDSHTTAGRSRFSVEGAPGLPYAAKEDEVLFLLLENDTDIGAVIDQIVVFVERPVTSDLLVAGDSGVGGGLELVAEDVATTPTDTLQITGLDGDLDREYHLELHLVLPPLDAAFHMFLRPNGTDANTAVRRSIDNGPGTTANPTRIFSGVSRPAEHVVHLQGRVRAARTLNGQEFTRFAHLKGLILSDSAGTLDVEFWEAAIGLVSGGGTNLTSLVLNCTSDAAGTTLVPKIGVGSSMGLFRFGTARSNA